ncbi:MAG: hypothetical protein CO094_12930 [Anaerolineae bacterium CG_4_9_14_3_um_filter_57_17]|nr:hypothetical protein [bacterium]NCT21236.1 hypothetical protein [bacterium]OIO86453.1 MAG: hypothetical protein AUK01_02950 [Anaerolineae bacterium CG2_30_57_67]PJB64434.1 MAG: hypothetical protein CO094_12930 [Anaerolineae bacterium CG_4_9_14_3_um_filter_57_17]
MNRSVGGIALLVLMLALLTLAACGVLTGTPIVNGKPMLLPMATPGSSPTLSCETCAQATLAVLQTQAQGGVDAQAAATAEIMRANAQATLDASGLTLSAALTQEQNNANIIAAQVAATAAIVRANAQATLSAAGSTQSAALTQDVISQTQMAGLATAAAQATFSQQNRNDIAAGTQTAVAEYIATQTQSAVATEQKYADQRQVPLNFLWMGCLPLFVIAIAFVGLWFFWRWMKIWENQQRIEMQPVAPIVIEANPQSVDEAVNSPYPLVKRHDPIGGWMKEIKRKLIAGKKDDHE